MIETWPGCAFDTVKDWSRSYKPGWVRVPQDDPAYRIGARWYVRAMNASAIGRLTEAHEVTEHEDGTITVTPSLVMSNGWHGYLRQGVFEMLAPGKVTYSPDDWPGDESD